MNVPLVPAPRWKPSEFVALLATLRQLPPAIRRAVLAGLPPRAVDALREE